MLFSFWGIFRINILKGPLWTLLVEKMNKSKYEQQQQCISEPNKGNLEVAICPLLIQYLQILYLEEVYFIHILLFHLGKML